MENLHLEEQIHAAKAFFLNTTAGEDSNLYDHLAECLVKILEERPDNALDKFEEISRCVKRDKVAPRPDVLQEAQAITNRVEVATIQKPLFTPNQGDDDMEMDEEMDIPFPNLMEIMANFEQGGIGIGRDQTYRIFLALKQLTSQQHLATVRFWGILFGTDASYIIAEGEFQEGHEEEEEEEETKPDDQEGETEDKEEEEDLEEKDVLPESLWKPPPVIPKEDPKTGTNKKVYFVCNKPGDPWAKLPHVKPAEIFAARQIRKLFTGSLSSPVIGFPPFPGREENLLRAQIARISASTQISPAGYYRCEDEEDEDPEEDGLKQIEVNQDFEMAKISEYADSMNNWAHHVNYILPQGRCQWFNPSPKADDQFDEDDEDEDKEQPEEMEPETGPQILTAVGEDAEVEGTPAWSSRLSSSIIPQYAIALVSSNLWPGAHAYVSAKSNFENIYIGWGLKYSSAPFNPVLPPAVQEEFPSGADIVETRDPTVEEETAAKARQEEGQRAEDEEEEPDDSEDEG